MVHLREELLVRLLVLLRLQHAVFDRLKADLVFYIYAGQVELSEYIFLLFHRFLFLELFLVLKEMRCYHKLTCEEKVHKSEKQCLMLFCLAEKE